MNANVERRLYSYAAPLEFKVVALRECSVPLDRLTPCDNSNHAVDYWRQYIQTMPLFNPDCECLVVLFLNARLRIKGHQFLTVGTMNSLVIHPREVFRTAIVAASYAVVLLHNHPSGDPSPSMEDIRVTRDLVRAGQLIKIDVLDHIIIGAEKHVSLRELGLLT